jgi:hypothetical protein
MVQLLKGGFKKRRLAKSECGKLEEKTIDADLKKFSPDSYF